MGYSNNISLLVLATFMAILHFSQAQNSLQDFVNAHNRARAQVDCQLKHSQNRAYGENLAYGSGFDLAGMCAVNMWVGEKANYNYNSNTCALGKGKVWGHYTHVVWCKSVRLGCARVKCNNGAWFVTCNYDPPGNYVGKKPYRR
ncbi:hypothetical protein L6452_22920 [Arctium lappa]|uniref:Uncharacterized protein n=1 Tax=Arctium lappa TaxID=4217 RepID=A0ACB9B5H0_ARCLA|nr:hypothetical protein L6452_22920 [Arctium lappa]